MLLAVTVTGPASPRLPVLTKEPIVLGAELPVASTVILGAVTLTGSARPVLFVTLPSVPPIVTRSSPPLATDTLPARPELPASDAELMPVRRLVPSPLTLIEPVV